MSKTCTKCKNKKALSEFYTYKRNTAKGLKSYVYSRCKQCKYEACRAWAKANRNTYRQSVREAMRRKRAGIKRKSRQTHDEYMARKYVYRNKRYREDPSYKLSIILRRRLLHALKGNKKSASTLQLLGTTVEHLRQHLEAQFLPEMTWENHGQGEGMWNIDHIVPCASFDLTNEDQQRMCFHWTNLQPLWWKDNIVKSDKVPENRCWVDTGWVDENN